MGDVLRSLRSRAFLGAAVLVIGVGAGFIAARDGGGSLTVGTLEITPPSVHLDERDTRAQLSIRNRGRGTPSYRLSSEAGWLSALPSEGRVERTVTIEVVADRHGLARGTLEATLIVESAGVRGSVPVSLIVGTPPRATGPAKLDLLTDRLDLGTTATAADARLANAGAARLSWRSRPSERWIRVVPGEGAIAGGASARVRIAVDRAALEPGSYEAVVDLSSNGGDARIGVTVTARVTALLDVSRARLDFGTATGGTRTRHFSIANAGHAPLEWEATIHAPFLSLPGAAEGTLGPGRSVRVPARWDFDTSVYGRYQTEITISSNGGSDAIVAVGATDPHPPEAKDREMRTRHEHCDGGDCRMFRHARAKVTDEFSRIESVRVEYQICSRTGPEGTTPTCDGWRFVPMEASGGDVWQADVGPLPECLPGLSAYVAWRIHTRDELGNVGQFPGSKVHEVQNHCGD